MELSIKNEAAANQTADPINLNEVVKTTKKAEIDAFFVQNHTWLNKNLTLGKQHACNDKGTEGGDGPYSPNGLSIVNTYTEVTTGSKGVAAVVTNLMAIPITNTKLSK